MTCRGKNILAGRVNPGFRYPEHCMMILGNKVWQKPGKNGIPGVSKYNMEQD